MVRCVRLSFVFAPVLAQDFVPGTEGTPDGVSREFDCKVRTAAWEYGKELLPQRGSFRTLFEALQLQACGLTTPAEMDAWQPAEKPVPTTGTVIYADAASGSDDNAGTKEKPFKTIAKAIESVTGKADATVVLREGTFHTQTVDLGPEHSGLTVMNYPGERAVVSGGVPLNIPKDAWKPYTAWDIFQDQNNVYCKAQSRADTETVKYIGTFQTLEECQAGLSTSTKGPFQAFTWHRPDFEKQDFAGQCFGTTDGEWSPTAQDHVISGELRGGGSSNIWVADVGSQVAEVPGLRRDGERMVRAKYPNGNPEQSGTWMRGAGLFSDGDYIKGWVKDGQFTWVPPFRKPDSEEIIVNDADWPSVEWPHYEGDQTGEGDQGDFHIGVGGYCDDLNDPVTGPTGYWCGMNPPRGQCWDKETNKGSGCTQSHMSPDGLEWPRGADYSDPSTAVVVAWRGGGRWFTQMWNVSHWVAENTTFIFDPRTGHQGGEGMTSAGQFWIENVFEELDDADEWFFDEKTGRLYVAFNGTDAPTGQERWVATAARELFHVEGTQESPVRDVTFCGLELRDTRITYLDAHGMPSGGDWGLQRSGAIFFQGTERCTVDGNLLTRLDGNGVFFSNYNRNGTISNNEVSWHGDNVFAAWGSTGKCLNENCTKKLDWPVGPDGRNGEQPRFTTVSGNLVREFGIWQRQSSMWFQAVTAQSHIVGNVNFNMPRAGMNFNDGFGGGDVIENNMLGNCVRESGDHGCFNSWDRVPYITDVADPNKPSIIPAWRHIRHNFILSLYSSQEGFDTDDGSAYYKTYENFLPYAKKGLKSDANGHDNRHYRNVYAYVRHCWGVSNTGSNDWFVNNTCVSTMDAGGFDSSCGKLPTGMNITGNTLYNRQGKAGFDMCNGNTVEVVPDDDTVIKWGMEVIGAKYGQELNVLI